MRVPLVYGGVAGFCWYFLYDQLLCPHGQATYTKHILAYSIAGGILVATLYNPAATFYGCIFGALAGTFSDYIKYFGTTYPRNFIMYL